jgi:putative transcriptional regulator
MGKHLMNHVRELRKTKGISQDALAREIGVSRQTMVAIEKGNYVPSVELAMKLAKHFQKTIEQVFYWQ